MSQQQAFPVTVYNCSNDEIIIRWWAPNGRDTSSKTIPPLDRGMIPNGYVGLDVFASKYNNASSTYASVHLDQPATEIHFTEDSGGIGPGQMPEARVQVRERGMSFMGRRGPEDSEGGGGPGGSTKDGMGAADDPNDDGAALFQDQGEGEGEGEEGGGLVFVPGLGYVNPEGIPPQLRRRMMMEQHRRRMMATAQQRRDPYRMEDGPISYAPPEAPPLPQYDQDGSGEGGGGKLSNLFKGIPYSKYILPTLVVLAVLMVLYFLFRRQQ